MNIIDIRKDRFKNFVHQFELSTLKFEQLLKIKWCQGKGLATCKSDLFIKIHKQKS